MQEFKFSSKKLLKISFKIRIYMLYIQNICPIPLQTSIANKLKIKFHHTIPLLMVFELKLRLISHVIEFEYT